MLTEKSAQLDLQEDRENLIKILAGYVGLTPMSYHSSIRSIKRQCAIIKFLNAWGILAIYEEQVEATELG